MKMRTLAAMAVLGIAVAYGQSQLPVGMTRSEGIPTDNRPLSGEEWRLSLVAHLMTFPSPVTNGAIQLVGMGDEAAVDVVKILGEKPSPTSSEIQSALDIVHMAFAHPESILKRENLKPQAAAFLVRYFASATDDAELKQRVEQETAFLQGAAVKAAAVEQTSFPAPKQ
jgi:hypothetical protein